MSTSTVDRWVLEALTAVRIQYDLPTASDLVIGDYPWCPGLDFKGDIDEVKVFNRALSPAEISFGYQISNQLSYLFPFDVIL